MTGKRKPRIFWTQYPPEHFYEQDPKPFPGIVTSWDTHPALDKYENELLWILNDEFNPKLKGAKLPIKVQREVRSWADRWIDGPDLESFSKYLTLAIRPLRLLTEVIPNPSYNEKSPRTIPLLEHRYHETLTRKDVAAYWLFCLAMTLLRVGRNGLGRCGVCGNYFIDVLNRGKKQCSSQCSRLGALKRRRERGEKTSTEA